MNLSNLPPIIEVEVIRERLREIFPEGLEHRENLTREISARTIFVMIYMGAIENSGIRVRPMQVTIMTDEQSDKRSVKDRLDWSRNATSIAKNVAGRWYAENTRESIRDEVLKLLIIVGAAVNERPDVATTSSIARYALRSDFVELFDTSLVGKALSKSIKEWRDANLSAPALARIMLNRRTAEKGTKDVVLVTCPDGEVRRLGPGLSSEITKAVIEVFSKNFLQDPALVFLSESKKRVIEQDNQLAKAIGLKIDAAKVLPDIIMADLGQKKPLLVFVEAVATDGPIHAARMADLQRYAQLAGFPKSQVAFVTAFSDRNSVGYQKVYKSLAWGTFAWFLSEPSNLIALRAGSQARGKYLVDLI